MPRQIFDLRITLVGTAPAVWRRVQVPGGYTLDRLSRVIQLSFGWLGHHLHSFEIGGRQYGDPDPQGDGLSGDDGLSAEDLREWEPEDELDTRLDAVASADDRFIYVYDFDDWWEHDIVVERVVPAERGRRYPVCLDGRRAGPPEDVGGPGAYAEILAALGDPAGTGVVGDPLWPVGAGVGFDPARFDAARLGVLLRRMT